MKTLEERIARLEAIAANGETGEDADAYLDAYVRACGYRSGDLPKLWKQERAARGLPVLPQHK